MLLNLWSTTCRSCLEEFRTFQNQRGALEEAGLRVVTLATDALDQRVKTLKMLDRFGLTQGAGYADDNFLTCLEIILNEVVGGFFGTPLPTSLLLDSSGNLMVVYRGKVEMETLLRDVGIVQGMKVEKRAMSRLSFGKRLTGAKRNFWEMGQKFVDVKMYELSY